LIAAGGRIRFRGVGYRGWVTGLGVAAGPNHSDDPPRSTGVVLSEGRRSGCRRRCESEAGLIGVRQWVRPGWGSRVMSGGEVVDVHPAVRIANVWAGRCEGWRL